MAVHYSKELWDRYDRTWGTGAWEDEVGVLQVGTHTYDGYEDCEAEEDIVRCEADVPDKLYGGSTVCLRRLGKTGKCPGAHKHI